MDDISGFGTPTDSAYYMQVIEDDYRTQIDQHGLIYITPTIVTTLTFYNRYPDNLFHALAKVGGLLALLKIGMLLQVIHKKKYLKGLAVDLSKHEYEDSSNEDEEEGKKTKRGKNSY